MKRYERPIEAEKIVRVPRNLDLTPCRDPHAVPRSKGFLGIAATGDKRTNKIAASTRPPGP
jgi:hypothetical protein